MAVQELVVAERSVGGLPRPPEGTVVGCGSEAGGCNKDDGDASGGVVGSVVAIEEVKGGLPRPPELTATGTCLPSGAQIVAETHLSLQASVVSAHGGGGVQSGDEAVADARLTQTRVTTKVNEIAGITGTDEHGTTSGCESGAGGCRLACGDRWADEETSGSDGNNTAAGGDARASLGQQAAAGGKAAKRRVSTGAMVQALIDDIRSVA